MKIKISNIEEGEITTLKGYDCSEGFNNLKTAVNFINNYGDTQRTYILHITLDTDENIVTENLKFNKDMELCLEHENFLTLKGEIIVDPTTQVVFKGIGVTNLQVNRNRVYEPEFVPLIMIKRDVSGTITPTPKNPNIPPIKITDTTSTSSSQLTVTPREFAIATPRYHERPTKPLNIDEIINAALKGTIYVSTKGNDENDGLTPETSKRTIQNAINKALPLGTIIIDTGSYDENIVIDKSLHIQGANATINGCQKGSCITTKDGDINISGITLINGKSAYGGGIHNQTNLNLEKVKITLNTATAGGAICNTGVLNIGDVAIFSNRAEQGGGIYTTGHLTIYESNLFENSAIREGGAIYIKSRKSIVQNSNIYSNNARTGGGIYSNSQLDIVFSEISSNMAESKGGGLYNLSDAKFNTIQFQKNSTGKGGDGGGIYNEGFILIEDLVTFTSNICGHNGGAIHNAINGKITGNYTIFVGNEGFNGGAIYNQHIIKLTDANYIGNIARRYGGALFLGKNSMIMLCPLEGNSITFDQNLAYEKGGAIYLEGEIRMERSEKGKNYPEFQVRGKS
jgi:predicted outer membrane repeat protein